MRICSVLIISHNEVFDLLYRLKVQIMKIHFNSLSTSTKLLHNEKYFLQSIESQIKLLIIQIMCKQLISKSV